MVYALTVHCSVPTPPPRSRWMDGNAVTTTSASRITMKDATEVSSRVSTPPEVPGPGCCPGCAVPGWVARPGADIGPIPLIRPAWRRPRPVLRTGRAHIDTQFESVTREPRSRPAAGTASMVCHRVLVGLDDQVIPEPCPASPRRHRPGNCRTVPSSEPIEPPAPMTTARLPCNNG